MQDSGPGALESGTLPGRALPAVPAGVRQIFTRSGPEAPGGHQGGAWTLGAGSE